ncbi:MAG: hypothetical protein OEQ13_11300, partial [Acidobacteriota bacterium]|nr:hypothetical protein [Acidobacteriota bacterium]
MTSARRWWLIYAACTVLVAGALVGMSGLVLGLERSERRAQADAEFQESLRLAMWRMESWLAPYLAREAARQHDDYLPYVPQPLALKRDASGLL